MRSCSVLAKKQQPTRDYDSVRYGVCGGCPAGCGIKAFFYQDTLVDIFGDEEHPLSKGSLCPKAFSLYQIHRHRNRLSAPCVRENIADAWTQVTWEEALDVLARRLDALGEEASLALPAAFNVPLDYSVGAGWCASVLPHACGPVGFIPPPLGMKGKLAAMFGIPGAALSMNSQRDWAMSRVILVVGGDMAAESPISFGPLEDARDRGSALLYIGACNGMTALRATEAMLVLPGTESAALGGVINILLRDGRIDEAFLAESADGLESLRGALAGMTPRQAARLCDVPEDQLERFAHLLGCKCPIQVQPMPTCDDDSLALCGALVALRGSIGVPGGGLNLHSVSPFRADAALFGNVGSEGKRLDTMLADNECRAVVGFGDWIASLPGGDSTRNALKACGLIVHMGCFDDASRALSHISLPAAHWSEYASLRDVSDTRALQWSDALFAPFGQSRTPLDIWTDMVARLVPSARVPWDTGPRKTAQHRMASFVLAAVLLTRGISIDTLDRGQCGLSGGIQWPCPQAEDAVFEQNRYIRGTIRGRNILFSASVPAGDKSRFATKNGRIRLDVIGPPPVREVCDGLVLVLAEQTPPTADEAVGSRGVPFVSLHPETALALNLGNGDVVCVKSTDAVVKAVVRVSWSARTKTAVLDPAFGTALLPVGQALLTTAVRVELVN